MGIHEAEAAMLKLESAKCSFDYGRTAYYREKVRDFVESKNASFPGTPVFYDLSQGRTELPKHLGDRIEQWMANHPNYSPYMRTFARNYLISLLDDECDATVYGHLTECACEGGDFYLETGVIYLRDVTAVSTIG
ncbi:MAG: hypothetical protein RH917_17345 [Lacipirellulaceae bacterium]